MRRLVKIHEISTLDPLILRGSNVYGRECPCSEYTAYKILEAERVLNARLRMLIGMLCPEAGESVAV